MRSASLFLPVAVPEALLFSMGDGHAARRGGEVRETATECPMERVELTFGLRRDVRLRGPRANRRRPARHRVAELRLPSRS